MKKWDEVNLTSIQGVCVDESAKSSVSRIQNQQSVTPPAGGDPEQLLHRENTMPKAASKLAAAPSTPRTRISNTAHNSSNPTTSLPLERTEATVTVPGYEEPKKKEPEAIISADGGRRDVFLFQFRHSDKRLV